MISDALPVVARSPRRRYQFRITTRSASINSTALRGASVSMRSFFRCSNSSPDSPGSKTWVLLIPCWRLFLHERLRPSKEGPRESLQFARLAAKRRALQGFLLTLVASAMRDLPVVSWVAWLRASRPVHEIRLHAD